MWSSKTLAEKYKGKEMDKKAKVLTARGRKQIKAKNFALPGGRYPIHDRSHARAALSMVAKHGTPEEQSTVRAAVHRKYPGVGSMKKEAVSQETKKVLYPSAGGVTGLLGSSLLVNKLLLDKFVLPGQKIPGKLKTIGALIEAAGLLGGAYIGGKMNKQAKLNDIYEAAFHDELEKIAKQTTSISGSKKTVPASRVLGYAGAGVAAGGLAGKLFKKTRGGAELGAFLGAITSLYK